MDALKRVVKVEKSTPEASLNLRRIFGPPTAEIRAIHASGFIEFVDVAGAEHALSLKLDIPGVRVRDVATQPRLVEQYRIINPSAFETAEGDFQSNAAARGQTPLPRVPRVPSSSPETGPLLKALEHSNTLVSRPSVDADPTPVASPSPVPHSLPAAPSTNPFICTDTRILMRLCGEQISLNLSTLAGDPGAVIQLLKLTASERGNWLIVGAYYRRTRNPQAGKAVVSAMLEAMKQFNIPDSDLKPAFLLLSGCESDLGKAARSQGDPADKIADHYSNAQKWLHKVYGAGVTVETPGVDSTKSPPRAPASLRSRIDMNNTPAGPRSPERRLMERELQSLRDRYSHSATVIADMRASKRKLEDTFEKERDVRRRLEHDLDDVVKERDEARRMEVRAVEQLKREADSRRRAEERVEEERQLRKRAESTIDLTRPSYPRIMPMAPSTSLPDLYTPEPYPAFGPFDPHRLSF
ncbi:hypothetical protein FB45DRAFT_892750 [Roridomyces roridus]|uniref:Uncharacterized protein n=1 Tax=Roridomyces roridus TaxID=1738132 RepID=A0AAD7FWI5_9AGAR|nr:hypothetical protein FB45DRAFT_892750 [Roridomyces roridus]